jgi:diguanylate cyclase (GGDEF)-like protein
MAAYARGSVAQPALRIWMRARMLLGMCQVASCINLTLASPVLAQLVSLSWVAGMAMELAAYCQFFGYAYWRRLLFPAAGACMIAIATAQVYGLSVDEQITVIASAVGLFAGAMGTILLWPRGGTPDLQRIIGMSDAILALAIVGWVWSGLNRVGAHTVTSGAMQSVVLMAGFILMLVKGFGFLLLCKQEDDLKMLRLATIDSLTGLLNRHAFFAQGQALRLSATAPMAVLMLDLDHFKRINDRFGHATGDAALQQFADIAQTVLAGRGMIGRLGGEEFAIALAMPLDAALALAGELRAAVAAALLLPTGGEPHAVTVSIGVALQQHDEDLAGALARADHALYDAKRGGRNRVAPYRGGLSRGDVAADSARGRDSGMAGRHDAILGLPQARTQFCA